MKFGARIIKTGLAVTLSIYLAMIIGLQPATIAAVSAVFAIQPSIYRSYQSIIENVQGNLIGAIVAVLFVKYLGDTPILIGLAIIIVIALHLKLKIENIIPLSTVTIIIIMGGAETTTHFLITAYQRFLLIILGVISAFFVNLIFAPPKYDKRLYQSIFQQMTECSQWIRLFIEHASEHQALKDGLERLREIRIKNDEYYSFFKEERIYGRAKRFTHHRKLVIFRHMSVAANKLLEILKAMDNNEQDYYDLPENFKELLNKQLEDLMTWHERIMLKFSGKTRAEFKDGWLDADLKNRRSLAESFIGLYKGADKESSHWLMIFPLVALITDYSERLRHLDTLIVSFKNYHVHENRAESLKYETTNE